METCTVLTHSNTWRYPCGCVASARALDLCALHAAAEGLLERLRESARVLASEERLARDRGLASQADAIHRHNEKNQAAINAAAGRKVAY